MGHGASIPELNSENQIVGGTVTDITERQAEDRILKKDYSQKR
jgi:hypothetical protein